MFDTATWQAEVVADILASEDTVAAVAVAIAVDSIAHTKMDRMWDVAAAAVVVVRAVASTVSCTRLHIRPRSFLVVAGPDNHSMPC